MSKVADFFVRQHRPQTGECFILMPFDEALTAVYEHGIKPAVEKLGLKAKRADELYSGQSILLDIWESIQTAEIIIADLTGKNANVMYELGLCHALWKRVILLSQKPEDVPFDLRAWRVLYYDFTFAGAARLEDELQRAISGVRQEADYVEAQLAALSSAGEAPPIPHPKKALETGTKVKGTVTESSAEFVKVQLDNGSMATLDADDVSWYYIPRNMGSKFQVGDEIENAVTLGRSSRSEQRIGLKQLAEDPWPELLSKYHPGQEVEIKVAEQLGAICGVTFGSNHHGIVPGNDIEQLQLSIGSTARLYLRILNRAKQHIEFSRFPDPWTSASPPDQGSTFNGTIVAIKEFGVLVRLNDGFVALLHHSHIPDLAKPADLTTMFTVGDTIKVLVLTVDRDRKRIELGLPESSA